MEEFGPAKPVLLNSNENQNENENKITPIPVEEPEKVSVIETKKYILNLDKDTYSLIIETFSNGDINFNVRQNNNISLSYYTKTYKFDEILQKLYLFKQHHDNITKILKYIDTSISQKKLFLIKDNNKLKLSLKKSLDYEEINCILELDEKKNNNDDLLKIITAEITELKSKEKDNNNYQNIMNMIKELKDSFEKKENEIEDIKKKYEDVKKENEDIKKELKKLTEEKNKEKEEKEEMNTKINSLIEDYKKMKENIEKIEKYSLKNASESKPSFVINESNYNNFNQNPSNLKFKELLTSNHSSAGMLSNFAVFTGLKDNVPYLVYNNKTNFNLEVMRLNDNTIVHFLQKHNNKVTVIKYYKNNNDEEFLLSCDINKLVVVWDIQNNFCIKTMIQEQFEGKIWDAHILFNISNKDFILLSSGNKGIPIRLYQLKENNSTFLQNIPGTEQNTTNYMIPWFYNNKYYIIKFYNGISIHNIFENECIGRLTANNDKYYCGFIYKTNYLCANDRNNKLLRIWDLVNKNIYKEIKYDGEIGKEIIPWNDTYVIVACNHGFIIVDIEKGEVAKKIEIEKSCLGGVKKIYLNRLGECLIVADFNNNIELFNLENK